MRRLRHLTGQHRTPSINRLLGGLLAFNAGAINAGGFLVLGMYTSHMTGFASMLADNLILGNVGLFLGAVGTLLAFTCGAASTAILVNWARQHHLRSQYALPLFVEAILMLLFGLLGASMNRETPFAVPLTTLVLAFTMGLQNAVVSKVSASQIRTTHMTGVLTDLGIELGKLFYWNRAATAKATATATGLAPASQVRANRIKLKLFALLLACFISGGLVGAAGFKYFGFIWVLPLATALLMVCLPSLLADGRRYLASCLNPL